jgi:hypothetical protein
MGTESQGCRSIRCVGAAGPRAGSEAGPAQWGRSRHGPLGPECQKQERCCWRCGNREQPNGWSFV